VEDQYVLRLGECGRCGERGYENLGSHGYCANCNYSPVLDEFIEQCVQIPDWAIRAFKPESHTNNVRTL
jgi:hypothetical protein